jgi:hypothetical protein
VLLPATRLVLACVALAAAGSRAAAETPDRFTDPFAYCAAVGTIDAPDARWAGPAVPRSIAAGLAAAFGQRADAAVAPFERGTTWRCMDGAVYACNVGANLPCHDKADTSRTPTGAMRDFCREQADADFIPAYVTGRATIYAWRCRDGAPAIEREVEGADARGFVAGVWHRIAAP